MVNRLESRLTEILSTVASHITDYVGMIASTIVILIVVPFVLFYLLKDGERPTETINRLFAEKVS